jgi:hypothetical protein
MQAPSTMYFPKKAKEHPLRQLPSFSGSSLLKLQEFYMHFIWDSMSGSGTEIE